jgi:hypothetical protein
MFRAEKPLKKSSAAFFYLNVGPATMDDQVFLKSPQA